MPKLADIGQHPELKDKNDYEERLKRYQLRLLRLQQKMYQKKHRATGFTYYQNWSLWDTYRTQAQLLSLLAPAEARDMALSVLRIDAESGWLPKWGYGTVETNIMTGDPVTPYLTNAYQQGLLGGHEEEAYRALKKNADGGYVVTAGEVTPEAAALAASRKIQFVRGPSLLAMLEKAKETITTGVPAHFQWTAERPSSSGAS